MGRRILRWMLVALVLLLVAGGVAAGAAGVWFQREILSTLPSDLSRFQHWRPPTQCRILDADGEEIHKFHLERRIWVPIDELPDHVWQAFIAAEDRRFFEHEGVDWLGIARAALANWQAGEVTQGGSTITQQLVKNLLVGSEKSYRRKLREAVLARRLEQELGKERILELFLNYVFLGAGNYGIEAAARDYFGVSARDLDPGEAALLAGLIPAPSVYNPRRSPSQASSRRRLVLESMMEQGFLDALEAQYFLEDPVLTPREAAYTDVPAAAYVTEVRRELRRVIPGSVAFDRGLEVHTPLRRDIQELAEASIRQAVRDLEKRQGRLGPTERLPKEQWDGFRARGEGLVRRDDGSFKEPEAGRCFPALATSTNLGTLAAGPFTLSLVPAERGINMKGPSGPVPLQFLVKPGDILRVCRDDGKGTVTLDEMPWAQGAAVVLDNATGGVIAVTGGLRSGLEGFIRATQARRQPGSSFKPYVYAAALSRGHTQLDTIVDGPLSLPAGGGKMWSPKNYSGGYAGTVTLRSALARSLNTPAVRLILEGTTDQTVKLARSMGVRTPLRTDPTVALGSSEVTPMDQALGYATIARGGVPTEPVFITRMADFEGTEVGSAGEPVMVGGEEIAVLPGGPLPRVLKPATAYQLADMLREVVRGGTARRAWVPGLDRAGKTGTTNGYVDAWFVGFTPAYTVAVWIGTDGTQPLGDGETGGRAALPAWIRIVEELPHAPGLRLPVPDEAIQVRVGDTWMGLERGRVPATALAGAPPRLGEPLPEFGN